MKTCFKCRRSLRLTEFYRHPQMGDGHLGKCKDCTKADVSSNAEKRRDHYLAYEKKRKTPERLRKSCDASRRCEEKRGRISRIAHQKTTQAIKMGRLIPQPCEICHEDGTGKGGRIEAHHDDYSKPLDVRWLCSACHKSTHAQLHGKTPWRLKRLGVA